MYIKDPMLIETKSFEIIGENMSEHNFTEAELKIVMRTIHTTGDYDYQNIVRFSNGAIEGALEAFRSGCKIVTDTKMAFSGINKNSLEKLQCSIDCFIADDEVFKTAKEKGITRSMAAVDIAVDRGTDIYVVGNAPTALFRIGEMIKEGRIMPRLVIAVPVGFVGAAESKEYIRGIEVPTISTFGTKGGSNVAAAIVNALLYMIVKR
jgi:precorrin-8X/cobalt-precorrin-8 methylmutase